MRVSTVRLFSVLRPTRFRRFNRRCSALLCGHSDHPALSTDCASLATHSGHNAGYIGLGDLWRTRLAIFGSSRAANHLERGLVYVSRIVGFA